MLTIGVQALEQLPNWAPANAVVAELGRKTGESASVGLLIGDEIVLIARHNSTNPLTAVARVGDVLPPHTTAIGKSVLANVPVAMRERLVGKVERSHVSTILRCLDKELQTARRNRFSVDEETFTPGMRCRAVPVFDSDGVLLGGISVSGPAVRLTVDKADNIIPFLHQAATGLMSRGAGRIHPGDEAALGQTGNAQAPALSPR